MYSVPSLQLLLHSQIPEVGGSEMRKVRYFWANGRTSRTVLRMVKYVKVEKFKSQHRAACIHTVAAFSFREVLRTTLTERAAVTSGSARTSVPLPFLN